MRPENSVAGSSPRLIDQHLWSADDEMASENEMREFLYGFVRHLKPRLVVETGSYTGETSRIIQRAIDANGYGVFVGCDPAYDGDFSIFVCNSEKIKHLIEQCDLLYADSSPQTRMEEVSWLKPGAIAVVHDTHSHPELGEFVKKMGGICFDTPRGFGIIRR